MVKHFNRINENFVIILNINIFFYYNTELSIKNKTKKSNTRPNSILLFVKEMFDKIKFLNKLYKWKKILV